MQTICNIDAADFLTVLTGEVSCDCVKCAKAAAEDAARKAEADARALRRAQVTRCRRCLGTGYLTQFRHVAGGVCFACC